MVTRRQFLQTAAGLSVLALLPMPVGGQRHSGVGWVRVSKAMSTSISQTVGVKARDRSMTWAFIRHPLARCHSACRSRDAEAPLAEIYAEHKDHIHFTPQSETLADFDLDFIGLVERASEDWKVIQNRLGVGALPHLNSGPRNDHWTEHSYDFLDGRYEEDMALWRAVWAASHA